jgi:hypothetical protein
MINLSQETEALAKRVAEMQSLSVENAIRRAPPVSSWSRVTHGINPRGPLPRATRAQIVRGGALFPA